MSALERIKLLAAIAKESAVEWVNDGSAQLGAALSFYTIISLAPLLIMVIMVAGFFFGEDAAKGEIMLQISDLVGREGAVVIENMLVAASKPQEGILAQVVAVFALVFGATNVFYQLRQSLNRIFGSREERFSTVTAFFLARLLAFSTVLGAGFLLLVSLVVSASLAGLSHWIEQWFPMADVLMEVINFMVSLGVLTLLFALMFRVLPNARIRWAYAMVGGLVAALLFDIGKLLIGWYLGQSAVGSVYGAAGSLVVLLVWVYYSAQIMLYGAEFTKVYQRRIGRREGLGTLIDPDP